MGIIGQHTYATLTNVNNIATKPTPPNVALANIFFGSATSLSTYMRKVSDKIAINMIDMNRFNSDAHIERLLEAAV